MPRQADRSARRRLPASGSSRSRRKPSVDAELLRTWLPPATGGAGFLLLYVLGNLDVIETPPALAADALLLALIVLFFPMRYAYRLSPRGRGAAVLLAIFWISAVYGPVYRRIYPAPRIAMVDVTPQNLPATLPTAGRGPELDLVIEGHLEPGVPGSTRAARYRLLFADADGREQTHTGEFIETWDRQARGRREGIDLIRGRTATRVVLDNPSGEDLAVTEMAIRGRAERRLTLSLYPHTQLALWVSIPLAAALILAGVAFDRATGSGETAASMAILTAAALTSTLAFQSVASPQPTFRELLGASIVGALVGGPIGGLVGWLFKGRGTSFLGSGRRAR
ncbi:MAG: hypothetical protein P8R42_04070 [Candidatus Binatia bacterium]|nr:hypothetical protein [Candidatus Binatia bacterium]